MKKKTDRLVVKEKQIKAAVKALKEFQTKREEENPSEKKPLFDDVNPPPVLLSITLKKIPKLPDMQMIKVPLPHTFVTNVSEVCLITGDLDKRDRKADIEPTILHYKELLSKHGVDVVTQVMPLRQLRTEYKQHEAKRKLYGAYDVFLCDNRITQCLPKVLGKFFFKKRKFPQQIDLETSNLKYQIENALSKTVLYLSGRGNSCNVEVAHFGLITKKIVENIQAAISTIADSIPGTWKNIYGLYIKTPLSVSIPLYVSLGSVNDVELPDSAVDEDDVEAEDITTLVGGKVKVFPDGSVEVIPTSEDNSSADESEDNDDIKKLLSKRKVKEGVNRIGNELKTKKRPEEVVSVKAETMLKKGDDERAAGEAEMMSSERKKLKIKKRRNTGMKGTDVVKPENLLKSKKRQNEDVVIVDDTKTVSKKAKKLKVSK